MISITKGNFIIKQKQQSTDDGNGLVSSPQQWRSIDKLALQPQREWR
uniref:Uncharacterized protein n=1 Tax=Heterorhabditis bacteriophora TaxID=37862 RepID=A0A1I7W9E0_HETBA